MCAAPVGMMAAGDQRTGGDALAAWAESLSRRGQGMRGRGCLRFVFYGRVSTEDWQDPVTSRARQLQQAVMLTAGHGVIVAESFDTGESRALPWTRRPQAAALVAALADPDRGWDAIVIGEYERAFYGKQFASMAPLFEHYGIQLWMPEVGGRVDWHAEDHEQTMLALGLSSKREITRTRVRVRAAMAAQTLEQGRYLGGRPQPAPHRRRVDAAHRGRDPGQSAVHGPAGVEPAAHRFRPGRPGEHHSRAQAGATLEPAQGLGHLQASRAHGAGQRSRLHRCPGHHGAARPRRPGGTPVRAGRAAGLRAMRAQARGIAACSLFTALLLMAANIRKIRAWRALTASDQARVTRRARRRRTTLRDYHPDG